MKSIVHRMKVPTMSRKKSGDSTDCKKVFNKLDESNKGKQPGAGGSLETATPPIILVKTILPPYGLHLI